MLKNINYVIILVNIILFSLLDYINLNTYGKANLPLQALFIISIIFTLVVAIIEIVKLAQKKIKPTTYSYIYFTCSLVFILMMSFKPYNPQLLVNYTEVWRWDGASKSGSVFDAHGKLRLNNDGKFSLKWRSLLNSHDYYGNWQYNDSILVLSYEGRTNKRLGTQLFLSPKGELVAHNETGDFAPRVIMTREK